MTLPPGASKQVTLAELNQLLARAKRDPAERARLQDNPEAVLESMGRIASPGAVEFLRSMGETKFDENADLPQPGTKDPNSGMAEM